MAYANGGSPQSVFFTIAVDNQTTVLASNPSSAQIAIEAIAYRIASQCAELNFARVNVDAAVRTAGPGRVDQSEQTSNGFHCLTSKHTPTASSPPARAKQETPFTRKRVSRLSKRAVSRTQGNEGVNVGSPSSNVVSPMLS